MNRSALLLTLGRVAFGTLTLSLLSAATAAQAAPVAARTGLLSYLEGQALSQPAVGKRPAVAAMDYLRANAQMLPGGDAKNLDLIDVDTLTPGITHVIFEQRFLGVKVEDSRLVVSLRSRDNVVFRAWARLSEVPSTFKVAPALTLSQAEAIARKAFARPDAWNEDDTELVVVPGLTPEAAAHLAWRVHLFEDVSDIAKNRVFLIDAHTGALLKEEERVFTGTPAIGQGVGVWGDVKEVRTLSQDSTYYLADASRPMYNASTNKGWIKTYSSAYSTSAKVTTDADNYFDAAPSEVDAHYGAGVVYEYYRSVHGRNSWDNKGSDLLSYTHSSNKNNAFWSGSYMEYGDGDGTNFYPFAGDLSVAAHEMTHGVTQGTSALKYEYQPGALNEAFSDIMAKLEVDTDNWLIGDDVVTQAFMDAYDVWALRDMADPTFAGLYNPADPMSTYAQPDHMNVFAYLKNSMFEDYGGVHVNSGVINKMAYLLAEGGTHYGVTVPSIGRAATAKIFYRVNSASYLATTADFDMFATGVQNAAKDIYGAGSTQQNAVIKGLQAIGLLSVGCTAKSEVESNGTTSTANAIAAGCTDMGGSMSSTTDKDYFKVVLGAGKTLETFLRVPYASDFDLYLYQGSTLVTKSIATGNGQDEKIKVINNGTASATLYVMVKRYAGSTGSTYKYTLNTKY